MDRSRFVPAAYWSIVQLAERTVSKSLNLECGRDVINGVTAWSLSTDSDSMTTIPRLFYFFWALCFASFFHFTNILLPCRILWVVLIRGFIVYRSWGSKGEHHLLLGSNDVLSRRSSYHRCRKCPPQLNLFGHPFLILFPLLCVHGLISLLQVCPLTVNPVSQKYSVSLRRFCHCTFV